MVHATRGAYELKRYTGQGRSRGGWRPPVIGLERDKRAPCPWDLRGFGRQEIQCQQRHMRESKGGARAVGHPCAHTYSSLCDSERPICHRNTRFKTLQNVHRKHYITALKRGFSKSFFLSIYCLFYWQMSRRYCPLCLQIHWHFFMGKCQILSHTARGLFELRMQWVISTRTDILT